MAVTTGRSLERSATREDASPLLHGRRVAALATLLGRHGGTFDTRRLYTYPLWYHPARCAEQ
jgi:hypothetical protein